LVIDGFGRDEETRFTGDNEALRVVLGQNWADRAFFRFPAWEPPGRGGGEPAFLPTIFHLKHEKRLEIGGCFVIAGELGDQFGC
jgi:hypothetical protein